MREGNQGGGPSPDLPDGIGTKFSDDWTPVIPTMRSGIGGCFKVARVEAKSGKIDGGSNEWGEQNTNVPLCTSVLAANCELSISDGEGELEMFEDRSGYLKAL